MEVESNGIILLFWFGSLLSVPLVSCKCIPTGTLFIIICVIECLPLVVFRVRLSDSWFFDGVRVRAVDRDSGGDHTGALVRHHLRHTPQQEAAARAGGQGYGLCLAIRLHHGNSPTTGGFQLL